eukprot:998042-Prymnesium_polylepis.1
MRCGSDSMDASARWASTYSLIVRPYSSRSLRWRAVAWSVEDSAGAVAWILHPIRRFGSPHRPWRCTPISVP